MEAKNDRKYQCVGDNPIQRPEQDVIGRFASAQSFAQQVLALDRSEGVVVGILGAWGSGKTSFINLARREFERTEIPILDFNPWMFSGAEQLVDQFFIELTAQLKIRPGLAQVGRALEDYGEVFSGWARVATKLLGKILQLRSRKKGVNERRGKVNEALSKLDKPILVVLDDIDRLLTPEIRDVFRLVRLTANFPNIIYITAFDRIRVEKALTEQGVPGRDYLEKILQVAIDLPAIPSHLLHRQILSAVNDALSNIENPGPFDEQIWTDIFMDIIQPLIRNMRDVRRYAVAIQGTVSALKGQIALADVLALEAVRVFLPGVFIRLHETLDGLTATSRLFHENRSVTQQLKAQIDRLIEAAETSDQVVRSVIQHLFPAARSHIGGNHYGDEWKSEWIKNLRVAHEDILRLYLERVESDSLLAFTDAERAWTCMADRNALDSYLRSCDKTRLQDIIASLETYEDQFAQEHVVPGTIVLLNLLPDLPERPQELFGLDTRMVVTRVIYRLLRSLKESVAIETAVRQILPELKSLAAKLSLLEQIGYRENAGLELVSKEAAAEFEKLWRDEVRSVSVDDLAKEYDLLRVLYFAKRESEPSEASLNIDGSPKLTLALLQSARSEELSQTIGSRAVRRSPRLAWETLVDLYGNEATLRQRIESLKETHPEGADELLELASKYSCGWRPDDSHKRDEQP